MIASRTSYAVVYIVDGDRSMREPLVDLFTSISMDALAFGDTASFLAAARSGARCILLDIRLPHVDRLELQAHLNAK